MGLEIVWTKRAIQTFGKRIAYLEQHWTDKEIRIFTTRVNTYLASLATQPAMFRKSQKQSDTYIGVIIKQVSLIYRFKPNSKSIVLIAFIDNRQNPKKNNF